MLSRVSFAASTPVSRDRLGLRLPELAVIAYFLVAGAIAALPAITGVSQASIESAMAFSPADLVAGKLWRLPLSGLVVDGEIWVQLPLLAAVAAVLVATAGGRLFWRVAIAAHIGSTLLAYAVVGSLAVTAPSVTHAVISEPDFGISCIWAGCLGALAITAARRSGRKRVAFVLFAGIALLTAVPIGLDGLGAEGFVTAGTLDLSPLEHVLAFGIGVLVANTALRASPARPPLAGMDAPRSPLRC
jgi:putative copper export protein